MQIENRDIGSLVEFPGNAKTHPDEQIGKIAASISEFGFTYPILVDADSNVIAGHGRLRAARALGMATVPVMVADGWTEAQVRAYRLADNRIAEDGEWDPELLKKEIEALLGFDFDTSITGFEQEEIDALFGVEPVSTNDPDAVPDTPEVALTKSGDVWVLGPHKIVCADCRNGGSYAALGGERFDACWTDPPYNVDYHRTIANDSMDALAFAMFLKESFRLAFEMLKPGGAIYVAHADTEGLNFRRAFTDVGFKLSGCIVWAKDSLVLGRSDYQWQHEPILYGWKPGAAHRWHGGRKLTTVAQVGEHSPFTEQPDGTWLIRIGDRALKVEGSAQLVEFASSLIREARPRASVQHPTMKPVALIERTLGNNIRPGDLVLDPFAGSGSTIIAADRLGASCRAIEIEPRFVDVTVRRWQDYTGREAVSANGEPFNNRETLAEIPASV